jgi:hypothetical protein
VILTKSIAVRRAPVNHVVVASASVGYHAPLEIALPIIAAVVIAKMVVSRVRGRPAIVGKIVVRCGRGHVFTTTWSPLGSLTSVRLGGARFQYCPVGHHWALVRPVNDSSPAGGDRQLADRD